MNTEDFQDTAPAPAASVQDRAHDLLHDADVYVRANPIPAIFAALGVGFAIGLATRMIEPPAPKYEPLHDALDELRGLLSSSAKKGKAAYSQSAEAVRDALEQAVGKARDIDVDPVTKWWKKLWS